MENNIKNRNKNIKIEYYSYNEEMIGHIEPKKIHVFSNSQDGKAAKEMHLDRMNKENKIFEKQPKIMSLTEFKTNLFLTDKIIIKEEKQVIAFYRALTERHKKELGVDNYYDVIDIAANFLNFFKLLKENRMENLGNLEEVEKLRPWQKKIYNLFMDIRENYEAFLKMRRYADPVFIIEDENYTSLSLYEKDLSKEVVIYNKLYFSKQENWILDRLVEDGFKITLKLQMSKESFDEENLRLKDIKLDKNIKKSNKEINIYTVDDEFTELVKVFDLLEEREKVNQKLKWKERVDYKIFDENDENFRYNKFFQSSKYISDFPIFRLLDGIHQLLSTLEIIEGNITADLYSLLEVIKCDEIKEYYSINNQELENVKEIIKEGYKYIIVSDNSKDKKDSKEIKKVYELEENHFIKRMFKDIKEMNEYNTLKKWLDKITFNKEILTKLLNEKSIGKYFEALSEIAVIEDLEIVDNWEGFFGEEKSKWENRKSDGLLKLILKYLEFKEVEEERENIKDKDGNTIVKSKKYQISEIETKQHKDLIFMNASDKYLPKKVKNTFLFTEQQKKDLGIKGAEEERLEEKYNFFRAILTSETSTIIGIKNLSDDSSLSPFVEEIIDIFDVEVKHVKQSLENYIDMIKPESKISNLEEYKIFEENLGEAPTKMEFKLEELKNPFILNAYSAGDLFDCKYKMNLRYQKRLGFERLEIERNLTVREYGILAHELFESVLKRIKLEKDYKALQNGTISRDSIMEDLEQFIGRRRLKLPKLNEKYYKEIVYKNLVYSVEKFFEQIAKQLSNEIIEELEIEKLLSRELLDYKNKDIKKKCDIQNIKAVGRGKADLIIKTDKGEHIIDFKTGNLKEMQLDFYSILYNGESNTTHKYIFNVDKGSLEKAEKIKLIKSEKSRIIVDPEEKDKKLKVLETEIDEFLRLGEYERTTKISECNRCDYAEICKVGEIIDEQN